MIRPDECNTMDEVRAGIDALDERIVTLLAARMRYIEAAARIKSDRGIVRDEERKAAVIANAQSIAARVGFPPNLAAQLYDLLVESSITHEFKQWDAKWEALANRSSPAGSARSMHATAHRGA